MGAWHFTAVHFGSAGVALVGFGLMLGAGIVVFGLLRLYEWARTAVILIAGINGLWGVYDFARFLTYHSEELSDSIGWLIWLGADALLIYYFQRSNLKLLFAKGRRPA